MVAKQNSIATAVSNIPDPPSATQRQTDSRFLIEVATIRRSRGDRLKLLSGL